MTRAKKIAALIAASAIPAFLAAALALYALIQNNNQGEAFDTMTGVYKYSYLLTVFVICFNAIFFPILTFLGAIFFRRLRAK
jgi:hypothetical protein